MSVVVICIPAGADHAQNPGYRPAGQYYNGRSFEELAYTRTDPTIDFDWTYSSPGPGQPPQRFRSPAPGVSGDDFSIRWTGHLYVPVTGLYTFRILSDDGMRVWIGGKRVLSSWRDQRVTAVTTQVQLTGGRYYPIRVEYYQVQWDTRALLTWQLPASSEPAQPISPENLYAALPSSAKPIPREAERPRPKTPPVESVSSAPLAPAKTTPAVVRAVRPPVRRSAVVRPARRAPVATLPEPPVPVAAPADTPAASALPDLSTLTKGTAVTLPNLYFTQGKATLLPTSRPILNQLVRTLRAQPALRLEIAGHTDNVGNAELNRQLSEQRARNVRQYLMQHGIDSVRLTPRGYGGTRPVADNRDPKQRPRNRRVEVVVE
ncbi:PA14 domain-containing protein [Hymenobacter sp. DG25B]|uniref:PA14 domain-containing protein n=1 Tax=Hymenobacter sp. DG25B TaxID=1385664 RepID=UPI0006624ED2|nr:PA14 domain-containing protein [Hymenobacter sp. DG25B]